MTDRRRVVVLAHATDRTGPPMYLLDLLRHLDRSSLDVTVVALRGGELLAPLAEVADVEIVGEPVDPTVASPYRRAEEPARIAARRAQLARLHDVDLVVVNTAWSIHALPWLPTSAAPVLAIVHELQAGVADLLGPDQLRSLLAADRFVAGTEPVVAMLRDLGVAPEQIELVPYGLPIGAPPTRGPRSALVAGPDDLVVVAAAVPDRRKAPDLFVHLAAAVRRRRPELPWAFRWIGAQADDARLAEARRDAGLLDVEDLVRFLPPTRELRATLAAADAFVLTSREDAFPLAALEAALAGLPIACFDQGGMAGLADAGAGGVVPFPQVEALADLLVSWGDDPDLRRALGARGAELARTNHDVADHARRIGEIIDALAPPAPDLAPSRGGEGRSDP